ncbi:MAG: shikimate kinase [Aquificota bacterium]|nr:shikimate kinase [Aquificota bacterium]
MDLMKRRGYVVWIEVSFEEFLKRCSGSGDRPLLRLGEKALRELMKKRAEVYSRAHIRVSGEREPREVAEEILVSLSGCLS